ncbi:Peptidase A1 domain-containing protein [Aphelenchoides besseyi]|nr:Peptidase A1 domain-containing protein [Aphelenchoides besseyi]
MKFSLVATLVLLAVVATAFDVGTKDTKARRVYGKKRQHNAAELKAYHQRKRAEALKMHKNYVPTYPEEPIITFLNIGKAEQLFMVALESGSDTLWVLDASYQNAGPNVAKFDANNPNSSAVEAGLFYAQSGDAGLYGKAYTDVVTFFDPENITFGSVTDIYAGWFDPEFNGDISGAFGFAWDPSKKDEPVGPNSSPIFNLFAANKFARIVSQAAGNYKGDGTFAWSGTTFGAKLDEETCDPNPVAVLPLSFNQETEQLSFKLDSFALGDQKTDGDLAKVDTGLSVIYVPWEAFDIIYSIIQPGWDFEVGVYTTPCSNRGQLPDFVFTVGGAELRVPSTSYIVDLGLEEEGECVLAISYTSSFSTPYALGTPFLYQYGVEWSIDDTTITFKNYVPQSTDAPDAVAQV